MNSIKARIQEIAGQNPAMGIMLGKVTSVKPLEIQVIGDDKLTLNENIIVVPEHLTNYETRIDISLGTGTIDSLTRPGQGTHGHGPGGGHSQYSGDGVHSHPASEGAHVHNVHTFVLKGAKTKIYDGLKVGEIVQILRYNHSERYLLLGRDPASRKE